MAGITEAIWQLRDALTAKAARPSTSKAAATVSRVEPDGTVWVRLAGGDGETPITKPTTAEVAAGDSVTVEIGRGSSRLVGNSSTPAVGAAQVTTIVNPVAEVAAQAVTDAATAATAATEATESAAVAKAAADSANDNLKSVVSGAQTVEKAVSVMQTALEAVVDYDPQTDTTQEWFWHDANGAHVLGETSGYRNDIDSTGMHIVDVSTETDVAQFAATGAQIGKSGAAHSVIDANGQRFYGGSDGTTQLANIGYGEGAAQIGTDTAPYYTFGMRSSGAAIGNYSFASGLGCAATKYVSCAVGMNATARGFASHAEGSGTYADGDYSHAQGHETIASGDYSSTSGESTEAAYDYQTAIGKYNDNQSTSAFEIGNGTSDNNRSNALTVDWSGNVSCGTVNGVDVGAPTTQTLATGATLYTWGKSAMLVLSSYKTRYAYTNNEYSPTTKTEFTIPAGYRPAGGAQIYGRFGQIGSTIIVNASNSGLVTFQPNGALSANTNVWGSASWVIA